MTDDARIAVRAGETADRLLRLMIAHARMGELAGIVGATGLRKTARDIEGLAMMLHARADQLDREYAVIESAAPNREGE